MSETWVVVADTSRARFFSADKPAGTLVEIQTLTHPASRLHEGDLVSDRPGRDRNSGAGSHDVGTETEAKEEEAIRFATEVCNQLDSARVDGRLKKLYLVAAPAFLGLLRKHQTPSLQKMIAGEVAKNIARHDIAEIRSTLPKHL